MLDNKLCPTKFLSLNKLHGNLGKSLLRHNCTEIFIQPERKNRFKFAAPWFVLIGFCLQLTF